MYPIVRFVKEFLTYRKQPMDLLDTHVSTHLCWPWDLDPWIELNNGRTLTLYDLGRVPMAARMGLLQVLRDNGWGITVAGNTVRYRRRIRMFDRFTMYSRCVGWDERFFYMEQSMWKGQECCNHMLLRSAMTSAGGIVVPSRVIEAMGRSDISPELPDWVRKWIEIEAMRPWPPATGLPPQR